MITEPKIVSRSEQPSVGIRTQVPMEELGTVIPQLLDEVFAWLGAQAIAPAGAPFVRYHVINMTDKLDVEMGVPVAGGVSGNGRIAAGTIPAGQYATLVYTGPYDGLMEANGALIEWAKQNGLAWDRWDDPNGDAFRSRIEFYHTDPAAEPDPQKWETEVAIKLADEQPR
jgi:effector-binding domain-containing protein